MSVPVTVVDYGIGNLHSVIKALGHEGAQVTVTERGADVAAAERIVVPGVGAFRDGVRGLRERGLFAPLQDFARSGRPFLGICVGAQLLLSAGEEFGVEPGLDLIPGRVTRLTSAPGIKVPHVGWNRIRPTAAGAWKQSVLSGLEPGSMVYFVHSYTLMPERLEHRLADTTFGPNEMCAAVHDRNLIGCQFHPEKSGEVGLEILRAFLALEPVKEWE